MDDSRKTDWELIFNKLYPLIIPADAPDEFTLFHNDIMKAVSQKIKWNVVGYTGYKEYAMQGPSDCFELLTSMNPSLWKSYGHSLYWQSEYASLSNNGYSSDIQTNIAKAAAQCGLADFWELHFWNEDILRPQKLIPIPFHRIGVTKLILVLATMGY